MARAPYRVFISRVSTEFGLSPPPSPVILATVPRGGPLTLLTAAGLSVPGAVASFKVFVVLESDNEKGSEAVVVTRSE